MNQGELWAETDELASLIMQSPEIIAFHEAERNLKSNVRATQLMAELRLLQEQVGEFQARKVPPKHYVHLLHNTESIMGELEKIPEVVAFQQSQHQVNDLLQQVTSRLAQAVLARVEEDDENNRV